MLAETRLQSFKLKGRLFTFTVIQLQHPDPLLFALELKDIIAKAPKLFHQSPIVLDFTQISYQPVSVSLFHEALKKENLYLVGIQGVNPIIEQEVVSLGLPLLHASSHQDKPLIEPPKKIKAAMVKTKMVHTPIRSGQQVINKEGDLIITAQVSHGAQLLANGHIHVYGVLRGRALAGLSGDMEARIFCQALEAELISIAGIYQLSDDIKAPSGPCQIYLKNEKICIESIC